MFEEKRLRDGLYGYAEVHHPTSMVVELPDPYLIRMLQSPRKRERGQEIFDEFITEVRQIVDFVEDAFATEPISTDVAVMVFGNELKVMNDAVQVAALNHQELLTQAIKHGYQIGLLDPGGIGLSPPVALVRHKLALTEMCNKRFSESVVDDKTVSSLCQHFARAAFYLARQLGPVGEIRDVPKTRLNIHRASWLSNSALFVVQDNDVTMVPLKKFALHDDSFAEAAWEEISIAYQIAPAFPGAGRRLWESISAFVTETDRPLGEGRVMFDWQPDLPTMAEWRQVLASLRPLVRALYSACKVVSVTPTSIVLGVQNVSHRDRCQEYLADIVAAYRELTGRKVSVELRVSGDA